MTAVRPPRESATIILVRDGASGLEVYMVRRQLNSDFIGGAYVFPGGGLDAADCDAATRDRCSGLDPAKAGQQLGIEPERAVGHWVCAMRETFEEAGLLLAHQDGQPLMMASEASRAHWVEVRRQLLDRELTWGAMLQAERLNLAAEHVHYFAHWVTPEGVHKRFTTRFFVAEAPAGQEPLADQREVDAGEWIAPALALARQKRGEFTMIFPTIKTLEEMAAFDSVASLVAACRDRPVVTRLPRVLEQGGTTRILLPGDPGYDEAGIRPPVAFDPSRA